MDKPVKIIVIDDEETMLSILARSLEPEGYEVELFRSGAEAAGRVKDGGPVDIIITDLNMPGMDGMKVMEHAHAIDRNTAVIVITAYSSVESAVAAIKAGAYDFIPKPFDPDQLLIIVARAVESRKLKQENISLKRRLETGSCTPEIVGASQSMRYVFTMIEKVRNSDGTVLIIGESGTGKELVAREIHCSSRRSPCPFIAINCGALPDELLESELFGYEKGAFTGAAARKTGLFEAADGGTVFLDEVSSVSSAMQVKLLRFLQERTFIRLGGKETRGVDVRIIAATNEDLKEAVNKGTFRRDLYYRLNVIPIELPPLRERKDDIPLLVRHFIRKFAGKTEKTVNGITRDAEELLLKYTWEGNVRELANVIERAITMTDHDTLDREDLPEQIRHAGKDSPDAVSPYPATFTLPEVERLHIKNVMESVGGNKSKAARLLGIDYSTLRRKLHSMNLS